MSEIQRPLSEQVARHAEEYVQDKLFDLQAPDEHQGEPEWLQHIEAPESPTAHEIHMRQLLGGMAVAGLVNSPKEYVDMLADLLREHHE